MTRIIIELKGGLVRAVWSTDKGIRVDVMDMDLPEIDDQVEDDITDDLKEIADLKADIKKLKMRDIYK